MKERKGELMDKLSIKRFFAFTLAETLIVMGIIGVVAALTIPNLNSSTADKEKVAKLKKYIQTLKMQLAGLKLFMDRCQIGE